MPTQLVTTDITRINAKRIEDAKAKFIEAKRIEDAKAKFSLSLLPYYRNALEDGEYKAFLMAARVLVLDRFPPLGLDPSSKEYEERVLAEVEAFDLDMMLSRIHPDHRDVPASTGDWRPYLTLYEDRKRRREEWEATGGGGPLIISTLWHSTSKSQRHHT
ncbi:hypothetical protein PTI98_012260 [Pleurotus ostreatus]|nr:hypothetical protein PTI98_012260 [Pleurotus ostreatus]